MMEGHALNVFTTTSSISPSFRNPILTRLRLKTLTFSRSNSNANKFSVSASREESKLDPLDQMELQFGRLLGEDPELTIAKIMARKADPDASYLEVEKNYNKNKSKNRNKKNKGKTEMFPIEWSNAAKSQPLKPSPLDGLDLARPVKPDDMASPLAGLNLARPVPKNGFEFKTVKPDDVAIKRPSQPGTTKRSVSNANLRKPLVKNLDGEENPSS